MQMLIPLVDPFHGQHDLAAIGRVLGRVDQQIREHLFEAHGVDFHPERLSRQVHHQAMAAPRQIRRDGTDGKLHDGAQVDVGSPQGFLADVTMRCVQQIIDVPGHLSHMPLDENPRAFDPLGPDRVPQQPRGIAHHGQRIAQLVRNDRDLIGTRIGQYVQRNHIPGVRELVLTVEAVWQHFRSAI